MAPSDVDVLLDVEVELLLRDEVEDDVLVDVP